MYKLTIPFPPDNFSGRQRELKSLRDFFSREHIMVIAGIAGIGKTALILSFISKLYEEYSDSTIIHITCENEWNFERFLEEVNKWFKDRNINDFDSILSCKETKLRNKIEIFVNILEKNKIFLSIDDFHNIENENARHFIRKCISYFKNSRLIICTRKRVSLEPVERMDIFERRLDGLSFSDSVKMAQALLKKHNLELLDENILRRLYNRLQGHPFSIKLMASLFISGQINSDAILNESSEFGDELKKYLLDSLFITLSSTEKQFLKKFSLFNIPVSAETIETLLNINDFSSIEEKLTDLYILERNSEKKYYLYSILKDYFRNRISKKEKDELYIRFAEYFSEFDDIESKLQAFYYWFDSKKRIKGIDFLKTFIDKMFCQGKNHELFTIIENILEDLSKKYPVFLFFKANIFLRWGNLKECLNILDDIIGFDIDKKLKAQIYKTYGEAYSLMSDSESALSYFDESYNMFKKLDDIEGMVSSLVGKADSYRFMSDFENAKSLFEEAREYFDKVSIEIKGRIYKGLGDCDFALRIYNRATSFYEKAIALFESINENFYIGKIKHNIAFLSFENGDTDKSLALLKELLEYRKKIKDTVGLVYNYSFIGEIYMLDWNVEEAEHYFDQAFKYIVENQEKRGLVDLYLNVIRLNVIKKEYRKAYMFYDEGYELIRSSEGLEKFGSMLDIMHNLCLLAEKKEIHIKELIRCIDILEEHMEIQWIVQGLLILRNYSIIHSLEFTYSERLDSYLSRLNQKERDFFERLFYIEEQDDKLYELQKYDGNIKLSEGEYAGILKDVSEYELWVDLNARNIIEKTKGNLKVFSKRTVANVFMFFLNNVGKELSFKEIFENIWKRDYDPQTDAITVRVNISRLRGVLEPEPKNPKYIVNARESGYYLFNPKVKYGVLKKL